MPVLSREFQLDPRVLGAGSAASLTLGGSTSADTLASIAVNRPFPPGHIDLAHIALQAGTGSGVAFNAGSATVRFEGSASVQSGIGIFDSVGEALDSLELGSPKAVLKLAPEAGTRWAALRWGYVVGGKATAAHPIGVVGSATLGVEAKHEGLFAVLHRFDAATGARDALAATVDSWKLPRHVDYDAGDVNLRPGTWLVAEADGSLAVTLSARLGYDISFMHETTALGLTRDLGAKIDANLKATFGVSVSGRYLVVVGRHGAAPHVRLSLHKQSKHGLSFGLNLDVGVKGMTPLPKTFDGFVQTVFGVHGTQVLKELQAIEGWLDPEKDLGETTARLATRVGLDLLRETTGVDPVARFAEARGKLGGALQLWNRLPDGVTAMLWQFLGTPDPERLETFKALLRGLADPDPSVRRQTLATALNVGTLADNPALSWLQSFADRGLASLSQDLDGLGAVARGTLAVLDNDVVQRLHDFISKRLDLAAIRQAVTEDDFGALDEWLVRRLGDLINTRTPRIEDLKQVQKAVLAVDAKVRGVYENGVKALSKRYGAEFAATYQQTTTDAALLDADFDLSVPESLAQFRSVVQRADLDAVIASPAKGVTLHEATLTHGLRRTERVELRLPFITGTRERVTESLATLEVEEHAGRVLVYEFAASDKLRVANRARSELSVLGSVRARAGGMPALGATGTVAYETRQVKKGMRPAELEQRTRPFIDAYLAPLFAGDDSVDAFFAGAAAAAGDTALSMEVAYPVRVLEGWLLPRDASALRADTMYLSRAVQAALRRLLSRTYFEDLDHLQFQEPVAALLVWSSMPVSTSIDARRAPLRFNTDEDPFWDYASQQERRAVATDSHTITALGTALERAHARLLEAERDPGRFQRTRTAQFLELASSTGGDLYLSGLLRAEALIIAGAERALRTTAAAAAHMDKAPGTAVKALAEFAATLVDTFGGRLEFVFSPEVVRTLGPTLLAETSAAIHPTLRRHAPSAILRIYVLREGHRFPLDQFLGGETPPTADVAVAQTIVRT